jgi:hypothetical protein
MLVVVSIFLVQPPAPRPRTTSLSIPRIGVVGAITFDRTGALGVLDIVRRGLW